MHLDWKTWRRKAYDGVTAAGAVVSVVAVAAGGIVFLVPATAGAAAVGLAAAAVAGTSWAFVRAGLPRKLLEAKDIVGEWRSIDDAKQLRDVMFVALVGPSRVGKSTLLERLINKSPGNRRTTAAGFVVVPLAVKGQTLVAVLDGAGDLFHQQFAVADLSHVLLVVLDHNSSDQQPAVRDERLAEHAEFLRQLHTHVGAASSKPRWVHLLTNKADLWDADKEAAARLGGWMSQMSLEFSGAWGVVTCGPHSNQSNEAFARLHAKLAELVDQWRSP